MSPACLLRINSSNSVVAQIDYQTQFIFFQLRWLIFRSWYQFPGVRTMLFHLFLLKCLAFNTWEEWLLASEQSKLWPWKSLYIQGHKRSHSEPKVAAEHATEHGWLLGSVLEGRRPQTTVWYSCISEMQKFTIPQNTKSLSYFKDKFYVGKPSILFSQRDTRWSKIPTVIVLWSPTSCLPCGSICCYYLDSL